MKQTNGNSDNVGPVKAFRKACLASCQKVLTHITAAKEAILAESREALKSQERLLRQALNEAEAVAWQTMYPYLVFSTLAEEKVQAVMAWDARQQSVRRTNPAFALNP